MPEEINSLESLWMMSSFAAIVLILLITYFLSVKMVEKSKDGQETAKTITRIWIAFIIAALLVVLAMVSIFFISINFEALSSFEKLATSAGVLLGTPATLAASAVALVLALKSIQLSRKQTEIEEKVESRLRQQDLVTQLINDKKSTDKLFINFYVSLSGYLNTCSVIYDSLYEKNLSITEKLSSDFFNARESLNEALQNIARNSMANQVWNEIVEKNDLSNDAIYRFKKPLEGYDRFKYYLPPVKFKPYQLVEFLNRFILIEKHHQEDTFSRKILKVRWAFASDMIQASFKSINDDFIGKLFGRTTSKGSTIRTDKYLINSWCEHSTKKLSVNKLHVSNVKDPEIVAFLLAYQDADLDKYIDKIRNILPTTGLDIQLSDWLEFVFANAFGDDASSSRAAKSKLMLAGYLLASGDQSKKFVVDTNLGAIVLRNMVLLLEQYFSNSKYLATVLKAYIPEEKDDTGNDINIKYVDEFLEKHFSKGLYELNPEILDASASLTGDKIGLFIEKGQLLKSKFFSKAMNLSLSDFYSDQELEEQEVDIYDEQEFWLRMSQNLSMDFYSPHEKTN